MGTSYRKLKGLQGKKSRTRLGNERFARPAWRVRWMLRRLQEL